MNFTQLSKQCSTLTVFRNLLEDEGFKHIQHLLNYKDVESEEWINHYCELCRILFNYNMNLSNYILHVVMQDTNIVVEKTARKEKLHEQIRKATNYELEILENVSQLDAESLLAQSEYEAFLPKWEVEAIDFVETFNNKMNRIHERGHGIYEQEMAFVVKQGKLVPVHNIDQQTLAMLVGYEKERKKVLRNTEAFMHGHKASNVLLYGDAGTGKSSTIKAIFNAYKHKGLRLVEMKKNELSQLSDVIEQLAYNPLKFIIFIDDLSFSMIDDNFIALKNVLEGGIVGSADNILIYATSNRRHFVKESMNDRNNDELFTNDTIQETMSLAARFGVTVTYQKPDKDLYLKIVDELATTYGLELDNEHLHRKAEAFAIRSSGRSPRVAKQFIEWEYLKQQ